MFVVYLKFIPLDVLAGDDWCFNFQNHSTETDLFYFKDFSGWGGVGSKS